MPLVKVEVGRDKGDNLSSRQRRDGGGHVHARAPLVQTRIVQSPNPFSKKATFRVTVVIPPEKFIGNDRTVVEYHFGDQMDIIMKIQEKYPRRKFMSYEPLKYGSGAGGS